jgi:hypothetical protein
MLSSLHPGHFSKGYGKCARPSLFNGYTISLSNLRDNLVLLAFEDPPTLLAALKDLLKITFLSAAVELIGHLDLSNINRKEVTQIISRFAPLKGCEIVSSLGYVHGLFVRNILIMIRTLSFHRRWWVVAYSDLCQIFACRATEPGTGQENRWLIRSSHREA